MKKIWIFIITIMPLFYLASCDDRDQLRDDIDELTARLDKLQPEIDKLNENISTFYDLVNGKLLFSDYSYDETTGNYTLSLSNGESWTVYSGKPANGEPVVTIKDGRWVFEYNGETKDLGSALPEDGKDGKTPSMTIDSEGYWCYSYDGEKPQRVPGPYNVAQVGSIKPSIFEEVTAGDQTLKFKLYGQDGYTEIPVLGGLDIEFSSTEVSVSKGATATITATLTSVDKVIIAPTPLDVKLTEADADNLSVTAASDLQSGTYSVYFEIYSKHGYRLVKELKVTVN